jgi:hypothetical protein
VRFLLGMLGVVVALPVLAMVGIAAGPAALFMVLVAGLALTAGAAAWLYAHFPR